MSNNIYLPENVRLKVDKIKKELDVSTRVKAIELLVWFYENKVNNEK